MNSSARLKNNCPEPRGDPKSPANDRAKTWTLQRRCRLSSLLVIGLTYAQAANVLGVHRGSVCWAAARYGIQRPAANLSRAKNAPRKRQEDWSEDRLTERWAERRKAA